MTRAFCITARLRNDFATFKAGTVLWLHADLDPIPGQVKMIFRRRGSTANVITVPCTHLMAIEIRLSARKPSTRWEGNREQAVARALMLTEKDPGSDRAPPPAESHAALS